MTPRVAGWTLVAIGTLAIPGRLFWIRLASDRGDSLPAMLWGSIGAVIGQLALVGSIAIGTPLVWAAGAVLGLTAMAWMPLAMLAVMSLAEPQRAGRAAGIVQRATFIGCASGPLGVGVLADRTGSYLLAWVAVTVVYCLAVATLLMARTRTQRKAVTASTCERA